MAKITRQQSKMHDEAMALVSLTRSLTADEVEFVYRNYNPMANHDVGRAGVFFTPFDLAWEFAAATQPSGRVIDLCSGIGILSYTNLLHDRCGWSGGIGEIKNLVAVEMNHEFVEIGKKLLPDVEWIEGSVFDLDLISSLGEFDCAISNPPYGKLPTTDGKWLLTKSQPAQYKVMELAIRLAWGGGMFIVPRVDSDYDFSWHRDDLEYVDDRGNKAYNKNHLGYHDNTERASIKLGFDGVDLIPAPIDTKMYLAEWQGAAPDVLIVDLCTDSAKFHRPYGFADVLPKPTLFDVAQYKGEKSDLLSTTV